MMMSLLYYITLAIPLIRPLLLHTGSILSHDTPQPAKTTRLRRRLLLLLILNLLSNILRAACFALASHAPLCLEES